MCLNFIFDLLALFSSLKQFIHIKCLLNILYHVSRSYLVILSQIKQTLILSLLCKRRSSYFPAKKRTWSERLRLILRLFLKLESIFFLGSMPPYPLRIFSHSEVHLSLVTVSYAFILTHYLCLFYLYLL